MANIEELQYKTNIASIAWQNTIKVVKIIITGFCVCFGLYYFFEMLSSFSGKETNTNVILKIIMNLKINQWLGYLAGGGGIVYGGVRNNQLKKTRKKFNQYISDLEKRIDPLQTSSRLTKTGETNEYDK